LRDGISKRYWGFNHTGLSQACHAAAGEKSHQYINKKNRDYEDKRTGPRLPVPVIVGRNCVAENLQWQRGDWFLQTVIPKTVAESSKKQRRRLAGHTREGKQNAGNNSFGSRLHHDVDDGFPTTDAEGEVRAFLAPLPIERMWGVGPKMEEQLLKIGVRTIGELAAADPGRLERRLGTHGHDLVSLALGLDTRPVVSEGEAAKSLGQEHTFDVDTAEIERLRKTLLELCDAVGRRLRQHGTPARTVTLKYRDETFQTSTRAETLPDGTDSGDVLFEAAWRLFQGVHGRRKVRLLGVYASGLGGPAQMALFTAPPSPGERARDLVEERFGEGVLTRASLLRARHDGAGGRGTDDTGVQDGKGSRRRRR